jgi:2'-5' RNA ligase
MPHITLVFEDMGYSNLSCVMKRLVFKKFESAFMVDNLALIGQPPGETGKIYFRIPFGSGM